MINGKLQSPLSQLSDNKIILPEVWIETSKGKEKEKLRTEIRHVTPADWPNYSCQLWVIDASNFPATAGYL